MRRGFAVLLVVWGMGDVVAGTVGAQSARGTTHAQVQDPDEVCASCHSQIYESWKRTPMANASGPAAEGFLPADFTHAASGVHYRMILDQGQAWLTYERPDAPPDRALSGKVMLRYYLGSGLRGRTWIFEREGYWYEIPINWYAKKHLWDMTPNYLDAREMPLTLPVDPGCLHCHASGVQDSLSDARNHFSGPPFPLGGISCAACHGDPSRHLAEHGKGPIVNPTKLETARRDSICLECHLEGAVVVVKRWQRLNAFRPGDDLFNEAVYFEDGRKAGPGGRATSQWESLLQSSCRRGSGDQLTCTTCHDPHSSPAAGKRVSFYRQKCLACHAGLSLGHHAENPDCILCHMPREETEDIAHEQVTDHRIQIASKPFASVSPEALVPIGDVHPDARDEGLAWAQLALRGDRAAGERAMRLLRDAETSDPAQESDADLHMELGFLEQMKGNRNQAKAEYQKALHADPLNETAAGDLAVLDAQSGDYAAALLLWQSVFQHNPGASAAGIDLAVAQCRTQREDAAARTLRRVLLFSPDNQAARKFSLALESGGQKCADR